jgi:hypothetical protein
MGSKVERSDNFKRDTPADVVRKIVKIMDPTIGGGTITGALKARSKERGEIRNRKRR